jgi:hypothetical protein
MVLFAGAADDGWVMRRDDRLSTSKYLAAQRRLRLAAIQAQHSTKETA